MPVIYVEPPVAALSGRHTAGHLETVKEDCYVLSLPGGLPGDRVVSVLNRIVQRRLACAVGEALTRLELECAVLWMDRIHSAVLLDQFPQAFVVYDCVDEEWTFGRLRLGSYLRRVERAVARRADVAIASSTRLYQRLSPIARNVVLVPNACDFEHFSREIGPLDRPLDLPAPGLPIIGFIGAVARRALDYPLLRYVFAHLASCQFVFVGAFDAASKRALGGSPNARLLGARDYSVIPSYLGSFDVAVIPYVVGGQIDYVYPKKLHEYLAAGKPVVATNLPELRPFEGVIKIGRSPDEFAHLIEGCLRENADPALSARLAAERRAVAEQNTWEHRVSQIVTLLETGLMRRGSWASSQGRDERHG